MERNPLEIRTRLAQVDAELTMLRDEALLLASFILGRDVSLSSFHGIIGGKNRDFGNIEHREFASVEEFQAEWAVKNGQQLPINVAISEQIYIFCPNYLHI